MPLSVTGPEKHAKASELNKAKSENRNFAVFPQTIFQNEERRPATTA
jgi:hypothetical protein